jgi:hypothetical protein
MHRVLLSLLLGIAACSSPMVEARYSQWRLDDDVEAFQQRYGSDPEYSYRIGQIASAWNAPEYAAFLEELGNAPPSRRAFIYYEISPANGLYFFALAMEGWECRVIAIDYRGRTERGCAGITDFEIAPSGGRFAIRDPVSVGLIEFEPNGPPRRNMRILIGNERDGLPEGGDLISKVRRVFLQPEGEVSR